MVPTAQERAIHAGLCHAILVFSTCTFVLKPIDFILAKKEHLTCFRSIPFESEEKRKALRIGWLEGLLDHDSLRDIQLLDVHSTARGHRLRDQWPFRQNTTSSSRSIPNKLLDSTLAPVDA